MTKNCIGRLKEKELIEKKDRPLTDEEKNHNLKLLIEYNKRARWLKNNPKKKEEAENGVELRVI